MKIMNPMEMVDRVLETGQTNSEIENIIMMDASACVDYAKRVKLGRWEEAEKVIASNTIASYAYACFLNTRFYRGENEIAKSPMQAYLYAKFIIGGEWLDGEDAIASDAKCSWYYVNEVIKKPFIKAHQALFKVKKYWYKYEYFLEQKGLSRLIMEWMI